MWHHNTAIYHLFPLGALCPPNGDHAATAGSDAPDTNQAAHGSDARPQSGFRLLNSWAPYIAEEGYGAVLLGPIWHSQSHGYDTVDYREPDPRLGSWQDLEAGIAALKRHGLRVVLDTVFNHSGRAFFAFQDVLEHGDASPYWSWYRDLQQDSNAPDGIRAGGWDGHDELPQYNLQNRELRDYLIASFDLWMDRLDIDGLRLDAADVMDRDFLRELAAHARERRPDFWLVGEMVHGDYGAFLTESTLDSVTNYELYKSLWSSHNDANYFELAWTLTRQFAPDGLCRDALPLSFADNHDVTRIADQLSEDGLLFPLHALLILSPGIPQTYYGSEARERGIQGGADDWNLRPLLTPEELRARPDDLRAAITRLLHLRAEHPALHLGTLEALENTHEQIWFRRVHDSEELLAAVNASDQEIELPLTDQLTEWIGSSSLEDVLNDGQLVSLKSDSQGAVSQQATAQESAGGSLTLYARWARVLRRV